MAITSAAPMLRSHSRLATRSVTAPADDPDEQPTLVCDRSEILGADTDAFTDELLDEIPSIPTDVTDVTDATEVTEPGLRRSPAPIASGFDALEAQIPTLKTSREEPTVPVQPLMNRANPTPVAPVRLRHPRRELSVEPPRGTQLSIEPPTDVTDCVEYPDATDFTDATDVTELGPPPIGFEQPAPLHVRNRPITPMPIAARHATPPVHTTAPAFVPLQIRWTLLDEYGWWLAGAVVGSIAGSLLALAGTALAVMNGSVVL